MKCKCGNEFFNIATNGKSIRCSRCGKLYNEKGEEVEIKQMPSYEVKINE